MQLVLLVVGKTDSKQIDALIAQYADRLKHYLPFSLQVIPDVRRSGKLSADEQKRAEGAEILRLLQSSDRLVLLDERGKELTSRAFAGYMEKAMASGLRRLVFLIGGPYGFSE